MKTIDIKAGQRTRIINKISNSIPTTYHFAASNLSGNDDPTGTVEVKGSNWISPKPPVNQRLTDQNTVTKGMWDTLYSVYVTPDQDIQITLKSGKINQPLLFIALATGIAAAAAVIAFFGMG